MKDKGACSAASSRFHQHPLARLDASIGTLNMILRTDLAVISMKVEGRQSMFGGSGVRSLTAAALSTPLSHAPD